MWYNNIKKGWGIMNIITSVFPTDINVVMQPKLGYGIERFSIKELKKFSSSLHGILHKYKITKLEGVYSKEFNFMNSVIMPIGLNTMLTFSESLLTVCLDITYKSKYIDEKSNQHYKYSYCYDFEYECNLDNIMSYLNQKTKQYELDKSSNFVHDENKLLFEYMNIVMKYYIDNYFMNEVNESKAEAYKIMGV